MVACPRHLFPMDRFFIQGKKADSSKLYIGLWGSPVSVEEDNLPQKQLAVLIELVSQVFQRTHNWVGAQDSLLPQDWIGVCSLRQFKIIALWFLIDWNDSW